MKHNDELVGGRIKNSSPNKREKRPWSDNQQDNRRKKKNDYSTERSRKREFNV